MLWGAILPGFSKTAGSHPAHREAGRRQHPQTALAVLGGSGLEDLGEGPAEGAEAAETDIEADVGDGAVRLAEEGHRALHAPALQVPVRSEERRVGKEAR